MNKEQVKSMKSFYEEQLKIALIESLQMEPSAIDAIWSMEQTVATVKVVNGTSIVEFQFIFRDDASDDEMVLSTSAYRLLTDNSGIIIGIVSEPAVTNLLTIRTVQETVKRVLAMEFTEADAAECDMERTADVNK